MRSRKLTTRVIVATLLALAASGCSSVTTGGDSKTSLGTSGKTVPENTTVSQSPEQAADNLTQDGISSTTSSISPSSTEPSPTSDGCENGWTDPTNLSPSREPARCAPAYPAPQPLPTKTKITVVSATLVGEFLAHLHLAITKGEFDKENLEVELVQVPPADAVNLLATGDADAYFGGPSAAFINAIDAGVEMKWVLGNMFPNKSSMTGLWIADQDGRPGTVSDLDGKVLGTVNGAGSITMYPIVEAFEAAGVPLGNVEFQIAPVADIAVALENGAMPAAWLSEPFWNDFVDKPGFSFVVGQPMGEPLGGTIFGNTLLKDNPEAGVAFLRALIRSINTYLPVGYKENSDFVVELSDIIGLPAESISEVPPLDFDWEIREGTTDRLQHAYHVTGAVPESVNIPEDRLVDRSFYERAVGHSES